MEEIKLSRHDHYFYAHSDFFNYSQDLVHAFLMKDYEIGMHEQEFYEINVVTRGNGIHYIDSRRVNAKVGDVFIIPPRISHGYVGGNGFDVFHIIFSDGFMNKYIADMQRLPSFYTLFGAEPMMRGKTSNTLHLTLTDKELNETINIMEEIARYRRFGDSVQDLIRSNFAMIAIGLLCNAYSTSVAQNQFNSMEDRAIMKSISFIHEKYFEKITIDDLTKIAHISRSLYIKKFKEICKMTPSAYLTKIRVESAAVMLINTELSVAEIAYRTGFYDASHFTKSFINAYSMSPILYRSKNRT